MGGYKTLLTFANLRFTFVSSSNVYWQEEEREAERISARYLAARRRMEYVLRTKQGQAGLWDQDDIKHTSGDQQPSLCS